MELLILVSTVLFFVLTPGVLLRLPTKGSLLLSAGVHAVVFAILLWAILKFVFKRSEGFSEGLTQAQADALKKQSQQNVAGASNASGGYRK